MAFTDDMETNICDNNNNADERMTTTNYEQSETMSTDEMDVSDVSFQNENNNEEIPEKQMVQNLIQQNARLTEELTKLNEQIRAQNAQIAKLQELLKQTLQGRKMSLSSSSEDPV